MGGGGGWDKEGGESKVERWEQKGGEGGVSRERRGGKERRGALNFPRIHKPSPPPLPPEVKLFGITLWL